MTLSKDLPERVKRAIACGQGVPRESVLARSALAAAKPAGNVRPQGRSKLQASYADELELRRRAGELLDVVEEAVTLRLAHRTWARFDFLLRFADGHLEVHEVKGHWEDDARVKIKTAAELHGWARFYAVTRAKMRDGGAWKLEAIPGPRFPR